MKTNKILSFAAAALLMAAGACTDEVKYDPAQKFNGDEVYFDLNEIGELDIETDATSVSFHLYRVDTSKEINVALNSTVTNSEGESVAQIFDVPTTVTFPAGESFIEVPIGVTFSAVESEVPYTLMVSVGGADDAVTPYGPTEATFTLIYGIKYEPWHEYLADEYATFQMKGLWSYLYETPLYERKSINMPNLTMFRAEGPFSDLLYNYDMTVNYDYKLEVEGETDDCYLVYMQPLPLEAEGFDPFGDGSIFSFIDAFYYVSNIAIANGFPTDPETIIWIATEALTNPVQLSYYVPARGQIYLNLMAMKYGDYLKGETGYYPSAGGVQFIQFPGFKSYGVVAFEDGYSIQPGGDEVKKIIVRKTEDTPEMKFALYSGTLTEDEVAAKAHEILADENIETVEDTEVTMEYELASGDYTFVVIGIDGGEVKATFDINFSYVSNSSFVTVGTAEYTDGFMNTIDTSNPTITVTVDLQQDVNNPGIYRLKNPYRAWMAEAIEEELGYDESMLLPGNYYITINAEDKRMVYIEQSNTGLQFDTMQGPLYVYSLAAQRLAQGVKPSTIKLQQQCGRLNGNTITFPVVKDGAALLMAYASELPNYTNADMKNSFKVVLNITEEEGAPIRGTRTATTAAGSRRASVMAARTVGQMVEAAIR